MAPDKGPRIITGRFPTRSEHLGFQMRPEESVEAFFADEDEQNGERGGWRATELLTTLPIDQQNAELFADEATLLDQPAPWSLSAPARPEARATAPAPPSAAAPPRIDRDRRAVARPRTPSRLTITRAGLFAIAVAVGFFGARLWVTRVLVVRSADVAAPTAPPSASAHRDLRLPAPPPSTTATVAGTTGADPLSAAPQALESIPPGSEARPPAGSSTPTVDAPRASVATERNVAPPAGPPDASRTRDVTQTSTATEPTRDGSSRTETPTAPSQPNPPPPAAAPPVQPLTLDTLPVATLPTEGRSTASATRGVAPLPVPPPDATAPSAASAGPAPAARTSVDESARVRATLSKYEAAYSDLDAAAVSAVWPTVDRRALAKAFDALASQQVLFEDCQVRVAGMTARATCAGTAAWLPKVGGGKPQEKPRTWTFDLRNATGSWQIVRAEVR